MENFDYRSILVDTGSIVHCNNTNLTKTAKQSQYSELQKNRSNLQCILKATRDITLLYLYSTSAELSGVQNGRNSQKGWALISASGSALYLNSSILSLMMTTELGEPGVFQLFLPWCR